MDDTGGFWGSHPWEPPEPRSLRTNTPGKWPSEQPTPLRLLGAVPNWWLVGAYFWISLSTAE